VIAPLSQAAGLVLAFVFVVAAGAKLADVAGTRGAVADFGAPARLSAALTAALITAELMVAALLLPRATATAGAAGALALLFLFSAVIGVSKPAAAHPNATASGSFIRRPRDGGRSRGTPHSPPSPPSPSPARSLVTGRVPSRGSGGSTLPRRSRWELLSSSQRSSSWAEL
jgi:hypothetical protein